MNIVRTLLVAVTLLQLNLTASEIALASAQIPVDSPVDAPVQVVTVPFYTSGPYPEALISAITQPYFIKQGDDKKSYDINLASVSKLSIFGTYLPDKYVNEALPGQATALYIEWDFSKADPKLINKNLIQGVIDCIRKTVGESRRVYSKFVGIEKFPEYQKQITAVFPLVQEKK